LREKCRRMLLDSEDAQDVAQETFIRFWRANLQELHPLQITAWLYRTSTRLAIDRVRRRKPMLQAAAQSDDVATATVNRADLPYLSRQLLAQVAQRVPARELEVAVLQRLDGLSQQELSEVMGISDRTARRLLKKFDERLERIRKEA